MKFRLSRAPIKTIILISQSAVEDTLLLTNYAVNI